MTVQAAHDVEGQAEAREEHSREAPRARPARASSPLASPLLACALALTAAACGGDSARGDAATMRGEDGGHAQEKDGGPTHAAQEQDGGQRADDAGAGGADEKDAGDAASDPNCACVHGECVSAVDPQTGSESQRCACDHGWTGASCDACATGYQGSGCADCAEGFFHNVLDPSLCSPDPCAGDPCNGHGTCSVTTEPTGVNLAACACAPGHSGEHCESCADGYQGSACDQCAQGYTQDAAGACVISACANVSCGAHGSCIDRQGSGVCTCETGWTGTHCDACVDGYVLDQGSCVPGPCLGVACGGGTCFAATGVAACLCPRGYTGDACGDCASGFIPVASGEATTCANVLPIADRRLVAQFDAAAPATFSLSNDLIDEWRASRGNGLWWPESKGGRPRALLLPPAVQFSGAQWLSAPTRTIRTGDNYTVFLVASWKADGGRQTLMDSRYADQAPDYPEAFSLDALDANTVRFRHRGSSDNQSDAVVSKAFDASAGRQLIVLRRVPLGNSHVISLSNGTSTVTVASPAHNFEDDNVMAFLGVCLGEANASCYLNGNLHEVVFYEGAMTSDQLQSIQAYLREKWSL